MSDGHRVGPSTTITIIPGKTSMEQPVVTIHTDYPATDERDEESESDQEMDESGEEEELSDEEQDSSSTSSQQENIPPQPFQGPFLKPLPGYALPHNQLMQQFSHGNIYQQPLFQTYPQVPMYAPIPLPASADVQEQIRNQILYQQEAIRQLHEQRNHLNGQMLSSQENIAPQSSKSPKLYTPQLKRPASGDLKLPARNKRQASGEKKSLEDKIFGDKGLNVEGFDTFTSQEDLLKEQEEASMDVKVPKAELERLIQSIPLEDRAKGDCDINETVMATMYLKCKPDKLGNPVVPGMKVSLMQHQLIGVKWMAERENKPEMGKKVKIDEGDEVTYGQAKTVSTVGGGLLADEMGLGKTIQSIALMVHNRPKDNDPVKTTLIVAPLALIHQWKREIEKRTKKRMFSVHLHHGSGRLDNPEDLCKYDVVITTYGTMMQGYPCHKIPKKKGMTDSERAHWQEWLEESKGVLFKIRWFRIILDEAHCIKNPHVRASLASGELKSARKWCLTGTPIHNGLKDMFSLFRFLELPVFDTFVHFKRKFLDTHARTGSLRMQVILRGLMLRRKKDDKVNGRPLIVLPEKTMDVTYVEFSPEERELYKAVEERARIHINKYLREGTAPGNYSNILAMLVRLRQLCIHPYLILEHIADNWTVEDVKGAISKGNFDDEKSTALTKLIEDIAGTPAGDWNECPLCLDVPTMAVMTTCRHVFCSECINGVFEMPAARGVADDDDDDDVEEVGESIACPVCRHKLTRQNIGNFTPPKSKEGSVPPEEAIEIYKKLDWNPLDASDDSDDESLPDLAEMFSKTQDKKQTPAPTITATQQPKTQEIIEIDDDEDLLEVFRNNPVPRTEVNKRDRQTRNVSEHWAGILDQNEMIESTKLNQLRDQLAEWRENHSEDKIIIFSQFVRALDLVERICNQEGWSCARYQGDMSLDQREASLRTFEDDDDIPIMLTSLKCGGVGLNLTVANRVICLDIWWNWQIENQAIDRAHRTGQTKPVSVARIIVKQSVEERILELQEKKKVLAATALGDEADGRIGRLSLRELVGLFGTVSKDNNGGLRVD